MIFTHCEYQSRITLTLVYIIRLIKLGPASITSNQELGVLADYTVLGVDTQDVCSKTIVLS